MTLSSLHAYNGKTLSAQICRERVKYCYDAACLPLPRNMAEAFQNLVLLHGQVCLKNLGLRALLQGQGQLPCLLVLVQLPSRLFRAFRGVPSRHPSWGPAGWEAQCPWCPWLPRAAARQHHLSQQHNQSWLSLSIFPICKLQCSSATSSPVSYSESTFSWPGRRHASCSVYSSSTAPCLKAARQGVQPLPWHK